MRTMLIPNGDDTAFMLIANGEPTHMLSQILRLGVEMTDS
jgi:hypothetical protein